MPVWAMANVRNTVVGGQALGRVMADARTDARPSCLPMFVSAWLSRHGNLGVSVYI